MLEKVKLVNGNEVSWEEFSLWSYKKQRANLVGYNWPSKVEMSKLIKKGREKAGLYNNPPQIAITERKGGFVCPFGRFPNKGLAIKAAAAAGMTNAIKKIPRLCKTDPTNYYYENGSYDIQQNSKCNKGIQTPHGRYSSVRAYADAKGISMTTAYELIKLNPNQFFYIKK